MTAATDRPWWRQPGLARVWSLVADRLEREGLQASGRVTATDLTRHEQRLLSDLVGRSVLRDRAQLDLAALDTRLRTRAGIGLVEAAESVLRRTLTDRPAARAAAAARRDEPRVAYQDWMADHPDFAEPRLDDWLGGLHRDGVLTRDRDPVGLVRSALEVLWARRGSLRGEPEAPIARTQLAAELLGDAHALDDDRRLAAVVLRAGRALQVSEGASTLREEWERLGVVTDRVSTTCLTLGLAAAEPATPVGARLQPYREQHAILHLTWRDLDEGCQFASGQTVLVSENPRVVEAAAELEVRGAAFVSTGGRPSLLTLEVLARLRSAQARLLYHGDFDWPGLAIANDLVRRVGVEPWRMSADDYLALPARLPLGGSRVEASWDGELSAAMDHRGLAVHEEAALPGLLDDLR